MMPSAIDKCVFPVPTRAEAALAVIVVAAAAVLSASSLPVPTSAAASGGSGRPSALPRAGDLTLGDHVGPVLVGLTIRPGEPGENLVLVYLLPIEGNAAAIKAEVSDGTESKPLIPCGANCRAATLDLEGGEHLTVHLGPFSNKLGHFPSGSTRFALPQLPAPDGSAVLARVQSVMHHLYSYRIDEVLDSGLTSIRTRYVFLAPDRMRAVTRGQETVNIGTTRWIRASPASPWNVQQGAPELPVPFFIWDYFKPYLDPRILGTDRRDGQPTTILTFFGRTGDTPVWFRLWVNPSDLVQQAQMRTIGHFMEDRHFGMNARTTIRAPTPPP